MSSLELAVEEFQFAATLGLVWSIPLVCASWGAFARMPAEFRFIVSSIPIIPVVAWICSGAWRARETFYPIEAFVPAVVFLPLYLGALLAYQRCRSQQGWAFRSAATVGRPGWRFHARFSIRSLLIAVTAVSILAGMGVLFPRLTIIAVLLFSAAALFFVVAGVVPHVVASLVSDRSYALASIASIVSLIGTVLASKLIIAEGLPSGPGLGSPNDDLFGPITFGFAISLLGVQALYVLAMFALGFRFGRGDEQLETSQTPNTQTA